MTPCNIVFFPDTQCNHPKPPYRFFAQPTFGASHLSGLKHSISKGTKAYVTLFKEDVNLTPLLKRSAAPSTVEVQEVFVALVTMKLTLLKEREPLIYQELRKKYEDPYYRIAPHIHEKFQNQFLDAKGAIYSDIRPILAKHESQNSHTKKRQSSL